MLVALVVAGVVSCAFAEEDHDHGHHGGDNFEWAGIFETSSSSYMWTAQKVNGSYADASMKMAALPASSATEEELHKLESEGKHALGETCTDVHPGGTIVPEMDKCHNLHFEQSMWQSLFNIDANSTNTIAFFTEHVPTEFEATAHYLKDGDGEDIEPIAELPEKHEEHAAETPAKGKPWGAVIAASLLIQLMTLVGVVFFVPAFKQAAVSYTDELVCIFSGFAAGTLLACTFYLLLFEATHLVATGWKEEVDSLWRWGTMILLGMFLPGLVDLAVTAAIDSKALKVSPTDDNTIEVAPKADEARKAEVATPTKPDNLGAPGIATKARLLAGILIGDFFHNLCDGFFVGAAFKGCGNSFGWGVAMATVLHELPQEISDFMILTSPPVSLATTTALFFNFLSGMSVILGAIVVLSAEVSDSSIGLLLAFGGGLYLHIAAVECMPRMYTEKVSIQIRVACTAFFVVGAILIGLVLLDHEHCVPAAEGESGGGGGHHH